MRRAKGSLESEVLAALWSAGRPMSVGEVIEELDGELAYTTVQTILTRLHTKGAVTRELIGRAHRYTPMLDDAGMAAHRMQTMLDKGGDHATVLSRFLRALTPEDEATLAQLLAAHRDQRRVGGST